MHDTDRYAPDGVTLDVALIRKEHPCRGETCRRCQEGTPCSVRRAADFYAALRARRHTQE